MISFTWIFDIKIGVVSVIIYPFNKYLTCCVPFAHLPKLNVKILQFRSLVS